MHRRWDEVTALACLRMGYGIVSRGGAWYVKTPYAGELLCPSEKIAFRTLCRLVGLTA